MMMTNNNNNNNNNKRLLFGHHLPQCILSSMLLLFTVSVSGFVIRSRPSITYSSSYYYYRSIITPNDASTTRLYQQQQEQSSDQDLLKQLDQSFNYKGRLSLESDTYRCGFVVVIGAPNMGKSTLLNALLNEDLCITTARPQTTRHAILGILTTNTTQVCLVDTPGILEEPAYKLQQGMMEAVVGAFHDADVLLVVTDLFSTPIPNDALFERVQTSTKPIIVCVNKIDLATKVNVTNACIDKTVTPQQAIEQWRSLLPQALAILPMTASNGPNDPGVMALRSILTGGPDIPAAIRQLGRPIPGMFSTKDQVFLTDQQCQQLLPYSPPLYDQEVLTDRTERFIASEMIRAALFACLKKELPYCCEVQIDTFKESSELLRISASVFVERDSQKIIVIGKNGEQIKQVGIAARQKLQDFFQTKVYLKLNVKVNKDWRRKEDKLKEYGYLK